MSTARRSALALAARRTSSGPVGVVAPRLASAVAVGGLTVKPRARITDTTALTEQDAGTTILFSSSARYSITLPPLVSRSAGQVFRLVRADLVQPGQPVGPVVAFIPASDTETFFGFITSSDTTPRSFVPVTGEHIIFSYSPGDTLVFTADPEQARWWVTGTGEIDYSIPVNDADG